MSEWKDDITLDKDGVVTTLLKWKSNDSKLCLNIEIPLKLKNKLRSINIKDKLTAGVILMNLFYCLDDKNLTNARIYYSRDNVNSNKTRYNKRGISSYKLIKCIDNLQELGLLHNFIAPRQVNKNKGETMSSFIKPSVEFLNQFYTVIESQVERDAYYMGAYDKLLMRDNVLVGNKQKSVDIDFFDDENTRVLADQVSMLNEGNMMHVFKDGDGIQFKNLYTRIFNNNDFTQGGRYYRASILNMENKTAHNRLKITIDDEQVCEIDFMNMHLRMLAEQSKTAHLLGDDAYMMPLEAGMHDYNRELVKYAVNVMINAKSRVSATAAIRSFMNKTNKEYNWQFQSAEQVLDSIYKAFPFLSFGFCNDSYGLRLMNIDSNIVQEITTQFYLFDKPSLPVHDSVIVKMEDMDLLAAVMSDAWKTRFPASEQCRMKASWFASGVVNEKDISVKY